MKWLKRVPVLFWASLAFLTLFARYWWTRGRQREQLKDIKEKARKERAEVKYLLDTGDANGLYKSLMKAIGR